MAGKLVTLEELAQSEFPVLLDLSVFPHSENGKVSSETKINELNEQSDFVKSLFSLVQRGENLYITLKISEEILKGGYAYKKIVKMNSGRKSPPPTKKIRRLIRDYGKNERALVILFQEKGRILELREDEQTIYKLFSDKYEYLVNRHKLSEADYDLLISAVAIANKRGACSLASNDMGILKATGYILRDSRISLRRLRFCKHLKDKRLFSIIENCI